MPSTAAETVEIFTFKNLWDNHPTIAGDPKPCEGALSGGGSFENQCAIRLGVALTICGVDTYKIIPKSEHCWVAGHKGHVLRAEKLAIGLRKNPFTGLGSLQEIDGKDFHLSLTGKTGLIFFKDFWARQNPITGATESFANRSGDHIDLWDGFTTTYTGTIEPSSYQKSKKIWFWTIV